MPLPTKFVELDFPGLHSTADYTGWRSDYTVAGQPMNFTLISHHAFQYIKLLALPDYFVNLDLVN
tara:strand:- start:133 stop:327 length:195 start_codon:yes stop_codon:yes gene_type:complete